MDYGSIDVLSTSQGRPAADASLGVTYRTIWGRPEDVRTFFFGRLQDILGTQFCPVGTEYLRATRQVSKKKCSKYFAKYFTSFLSPENLRITKLALRLVDLYHYLRKGRLQSLLNLITYDKINFTDAEARRWHLY